MTCKSIRPDPWWVFFLCVTRRCSSVSMHPAYRTCSLWLSHSVELITQTTFTSTLCLLQLPRQFGCFIQKPFTREVNWLKSINFSWLLCCFDICFQACPFECLENGMIWDVCRTITPVIWQHLLKSMSNSNRICVICVSVRIIYWHICTTCWK